MHVDKLYVRALTLLYPENVILLTLLYNIWLLQPFYPVFHVGSPTSGMKMSYRYSTQGKTLSIWTLYSCECGQQMLDTEQARFSYEG